MTYDPIDTNDDGVVDADVDNQSVSTDEQNNTIHWVSAGASASEINTIISDAADGDTVRFETGQYDLDGAITDQNKHNITLAGPGTRDGDTVGGAFLRLAAGVQDRLIYLTNVDGWTIRGLYLDGNGRNQTDSGDRNLQPAIYTTGCSDLLIKENYVYDTIYANIRIRGDSGIQDIKVHNNVCDTTRGGTDKAEDNISLTASSQGPLERFSIAHNTCLNCAHQSIEISSGCEKGIIFDNHVDSPDDTGIDVHGNGSDPEVTRQIAVVGNIVVNAANEAIPLQADDSVVANNIIISPGTDGVLLQSSRQAAIGNVVYNPAEVGVETGAGSDGGIISHNLVYNAGDNGLRVNGSRSTLTNNHIDSPTNWGVRVLVGDANIQGNYFYGAGLNGISFKGAADCAASGNYIHSSTNSAVSVASDCSDISIGNNAYKANGGVVNDSGTRTRINSVGETAGAPTASNWYPGELIRDTTNATTYLILHDGSAVTL